MRVLFKKGKDLRFVMFAIPEGFDLLFRILFSDLSVLVEKVIFFCLDVKVSFIQVSSKHE